MTTIRSWDALGPRLSELVSRRMGLDFPPERWVDLQRGLAGAARELGCPDADACAAWLLSERVGPGPLQVLANHLTVGETYFFRDKPLFDRLASSILPELIAARRGRDRRLRLWSAGCCTGEEAYSLAILLHSLLPDLRDWRVTILATDINALFLQKAAAGIYGAWSFRDAPDGMQARYFRRTSNGRFAIVPEIRQLVTFAHLNLAGDAYPSLATGTHAMDLILCRNVLMYFAPPQARGVVARLHHALVNGGWLAVSASESSHELLAPFAAVHYPDLILYRKTPQLPESAAPESPRQAKAPTLQPPESLPPWAVAESADASERRAGEVTAPAGRGPRPAAEPSDPSLLARACANAGDLIGALAACDRWIAADKLNPAAQCLRAMVLLEQGDAAQARASLRRALYLDSSFVLAHFALGNIARSLGQAAEAARHFGAAMAELRRRPADEILPHGDGLTAGRLAETIGAITAAGSVP